MSKRQRNLSLIHGVYAIKFIPIRYLKASKDCDSASDSQTAVNFQNFAIHKIILNDEADGL